MFNHKNSGLSIVELLISLMILGLVASLFFAPIANAYRANRNSQDQLNNSSQAEQILEILRSQWSAHANASVADLNILQARFDNDCFALTLPTGASLTLASVSTDGVVGAASPKNSVANLNTCSIVPASPVTTFVKRITISLPRAEGPATQFSMDLIRPVEMGGR